MPGFRDSNDLVLVVDIVYRIFGGRGSRNRLALLGYFRFPALVAAVVTRSRLSFGSCKLSSYSNIAFKSISALLRDSPPRICCRCTSYAPSNAKRTWLSNFASDVASSMVNSNAHILSMRWRTFDRLLLGLSLLAASSLCKRPISSSLVNP